MVHLFNVILYQPLYNILIWFYNVIPGHDIGLAILAVTILVKLILLPFSFQSVRSQKAMQELQPKLEALKNKFKGEKEKLAAETMKLYKENKVNPFSGCLPLLIQLPILIALYQVFLKGFDPGRLSFLYSKHFVH